MVLTASQLIPLGTLAPDFTLPDAVSGEMTVRNSVTGEKATVIMFLCNHCPYVKHIAQGITALSHDYENEGVGFVAISANDIADYPEDRPEKMKEFALAQKYNFPYLYDESQETAKAYGASCTPDLFIFDHEMKLAYHGQFDDARIENEKSVTGESFRGALNKLIAGQSVSTQQNKASDVVSSGNNSAFGRIYEKVFIQITHRDRQWGSYDVHSFSC